MRNIFFFMASVGLLLAGAARAATMDAFKKGPIMMVTAEYTPYAKLSEPEIVNLLAKYHVAICLCVREDQLNNDLNHLYMVYEKAGIPILLWPLLPKKDGLYVNKSTADKYIDYLETVYGWMDKRGHKVDAIVVDVEPGGGGFKKWIKDMDRKSWPQALDKFNRVIAAIHKHNSLAIGVAFPFVIDDRLSGRHGWEDLFGGPVASVDWDYLAIMMYTTWFIEQGKFMGMTWDAAHWAAYDYSVDLKKVWGDKAAVALGVTSAGEGNEKVIYDTPEKIAPAIAAVRSAGVANLGIYDIKGMLDSGSLEPWLKTLQDTPPALPKTGKLKGREFRGFIRAAGRLLNALR